MKAIKAARTVRVKAGVDLSLFAQRLLNELEASTPPSKTNNWCSDSSLRAQTGLSGEQLREAIHELKQAKLIAIRTDPKAMCGRSIILLYREAHAAG